MYMEYMCVHVCVCVCVSISPSELLRKMTQTGDCSGFINSTTWYLIMKHILVAYLFGKIFGLPAPWRPLFNPRLV